MRISPILFSLVNNGKKLNVTPKRLYFGDNSENNDNKMAEYTRIDMQAFVNNPIFALFTQMIRDGFTMNDINKADIFQITSLNPDFNFDYLFSNVKDIDKQKDEIKSQIFKYSPKSTDDVRAMARVYRQLRQKFVTDDVIGYINQMNDFQNKLEKMFGKKQENRNHNMFKNLLLEVLHNVNACNEELVCALLDDKNFDNTNLKTALIGVSDKQKAECALKVLNFAQDKGYKKDFCFPLAVMISQAGAGNFDVIERLIDTEQEFLSNNPDFVSTELINFLRFENPFLEVYLNDSEMSLQTIFDIMQSDEDN